MYKTILHRMEKERKNNISSISIVAKRLKLGVGTNLLSSKVYGFYWIYTAYSLNDIINSTPSTKIKSVQMNKIAKQNGNLKNTCKIKQKHNGRKYYLVYNGIGGGLRERILAEFGDGSDLTGSLAIRDSSLSNFDNWIFSYYQIPKNLYIKYGETFERMWRIEYGFPLLCRK